MAKHSGGNRIERPVYGSNGVALPDGGVAFGYNAIKKETESAWLFDIGGKEIWLAKSTTDLDEAKKYIAVSEAKAQKMREQFAAQNKGETAPAPGNEKVRIETLGIVRETEKAALVRMSRVGGTYETWVPKSQILSKEENGNLVVPKWVAKKMTFGDDYKRAQRRALVELD